MSLDKALYLTKKNKKKQTNKQTEKKTTGLDPLLGHLPDTRRNKLGLYLTAM